MDAGGKKPPGMLDDETRAVSELHILDGIEGNETGLPGIIAGARLAIIGAAEIGGDYVLKDDFSSFVVVDDVVNAGETFNMSDEASFLLDLAPGRSLGRLAELDFPSRQTPEPSR